MIRKLLTFIIVLAAGLLAYNFFLGTPEEQAKAKETTSSIKEAGKSVIDLLKSEKEKFSQGKFSDDLDRLGNIFNGVKDQAGDARSKYSDEFAKLEEMKKDLERKAKELEGQSEENVSVKGENLQKELETFMTKFKNLTEKISSEK